jgi:hypothetical protein
MKVMHEPIIASSVFSRKRSHKTRGGFAYLTIGVVMQRVAPTTAHDNPRDSSVSVDITSIQSHV